ncbi:MAG: hypothetical protein IPG24_06960 [Leptospiraceae bacterium]|nr:hypothetical protein [Leptospiraceae bacterium]
MEKKITVLSISLVTILIVLGCNYSILITLVENNLFSDFLTLTAYLFGFTGYVLSAFLLTKSNLLTKLKFLETVFGINTKKLNYNDDDKLAILGVAIPLFSCLLLSYYLTREMSIYNVRYQYKHFGVYGTLEVKSIHRLSRVKEIEIIGKIKDEHNSSDSIGIKVFDDEIYKYDSLKIGDEIRVFYSKKNYNILKIAE